MPLPVCSLAVTVILPTVAPLGSIFIEYVPVTGKVCVARLKLAALEVTEVSEVPSGFNNVTVTDPSPLLVKLTETDWFAVPLKTGIAFWPGTVVVKVSGDPPTVRVPVASAGTSLSVKVTVPVAVVHGSTTIVYVPAIRTSVSINALLPVAYVFEVNVEPFAALIVTVT